uniref:Uncharacterized protein n=1 Tax=Arundo donax TaxID=35708 RepID=A0A0A9BQF2_ARUDO
MHWDLVCNEIVVFVSLFEHLSQVREGDHLRSGCTMVSTMNHRSSLGCWLPARALSWLG